MTESATENPAKKGIYLIGTQKGKCQICKKTKKLLLLKFGLTLCEDCLNICITILENIQSGTEIRKLKQQSNPKKRKKTGTKKAFNKNAKIPHKMKNSPEV
jgi:hypothetical protein